MAVRILGLAIRSSILASTAVLWITGASAQVVVSSVATQNMNCSGGVCTPTAKKAVLNVDDLESLLASGNVEVTTTGSGVQADNIKVDAALTWSNTNTLALDAYESIAASHSVSVTGAGGLSLTTEDGGSNGTLSFGPKGNVTFQNLSSPLTINGTAYTLEDSVKTLASAITANPGGTFALASNYDASQDGTYSNCPIGAELEGTLQGLGNTVSNLAVEAERVREGYSGAALIEWVGTTGAVESLRLRGIRYKDRRRRNTVAGGLIGINYGDLYGDSVSGSFISRWVAAGLAGVNYGTIVSSSADVRVRVSEGPAGGLVGANSGTIELSHASGDVSGSHSGGLVSENYGIISQSYATGKVVYGGGLVGIDLEDGTISNSYATGAARGNNGGGFVQEMPENTTGTISDSYSTGAVSSGDGGFVCDDVATNFSDDYWDTTTSGTDYGTCGDDNVSGITGLTTQQLQSGLPTGFDPTIWAEDSKINTGLPYLINNPPAKR